MAAGKKTNQQKNLPRKEEGGQEKLWTRHGVDAVYFQRDAQVTFWTVLGGIAVAALLTQTSSLVNEIQSGRWCLLFYFFTSILLIVNSWVQNLWGSLVLRLQVTIPFALLSLMNLISLSILCLQVTRPAIFFIACGFFVLFAVLINVFLMLSGAWSVFTPERIKGLKITMGVYAGLFALTIIAAANLIYAPSVTAEIGWGVFALLASIIAMMMQHFGMKQERKEMGIP